MSAYAVPFAPFTASLHDRLRELPRVAEDLYQWLRRMAPPGTELEINLKAFADQYGRSIQWVKTCFAKLIDCGLLEELKRWWGYEFRVRLIDPDYQADATRKKTVSDRYSNPDRCEGSFKPDGSNPHGAVPSYKEDQKTTEPAAAVEIELLDEPHEPVESHKPQEAIEPINAGDVAIGQITSAGEAAMRPAEDDRSAAASSASKNDTQAVLVEQVQQAIAPAPLTAALKALIEGSAPATVVDALAAFEQRRSSIREPIAWLIEAVRGQWKPKAGVEQQQRSSQPPEFDRLMQSCSHAAQQRDWQFVQQRIDWLHDEGWNELAQQLQDELNNGKAKAVH